MSGSLAQVLLVAAGGATGAVGRFLLGSGLGGLIGGPWPTLAINVAGSLCIGVVVGWASGEPWFESWGRLLLVTGVLGGFTTYSAFAIETVSLFTAGRAATAAGYALVTLVGCIAAAWLGSRLTGA